MLNKDDITKTFYDQIGQWQTRISDLETTIKNKQDQAAAAAKGQLYELKDKFVDLEKKAAAAREVGGEVLEDVRSGMQLALEDIKQTYDSISRRLS